MIFIETTEIKWTRPQWVYLFTLLLEIVPNAYKTLQSTHVKQIKCDLDDEGVE